MLILIQVFLNHNIQPLANCLTVNILPCNLPNKMFILFYAYFILLLVEAYESILKPNL